MEMLSTGRAAGCRRRPGLEQLGSHFSQVGGGDHKRRDEKLDAKYVLFPITSHQSAFIFFTYCTEQHRSAKMSHTQLSIPRDEDRFSSYSTGGRDIDSPPTSPVSSSFKHHDDETPSKLYRYALPVGIIVGLLIIAGGTVGVVLWVQSLVKGANVHNDMEKWKTTARNQVYDACYFGCNDCNDPSYSWNACEKSAKVAVQGVICDGNKMWNWPNADRFPDSCLVELAKVMKTDGLAALKKKHKSRYAIIVAVVFVGILIGWLVYFLMRKFSGVNKENASNDDSDTFSLKRSAAQPGESEHDTSYGGGYQDTPYKDTSYRAADNDHNNSDIHHTAAHEATSSLLNKSSSQSRDFSPGPFADPPSRHSSTKSSRSSTHSGPRLSGVLTSAMLAASTHRANAYACTGKDPIHNQYFVSVATIPGTNTPKISGVIHGWLSDCNDKKECKQKCSSKNCKRESFFPGGILFGRTTTTTSKTTTKTSSGSGSGCKNKKCKNDCKTITSSTKAPKAYVDAAVAKVTGCGFKTAAAVAQTVDLRVGNPNIEKNLWVRISVSGFNVTKAGETDKEVLCLYGIGGSA
ncbi:hypothetical protein QBC38DRAFT_485959 [Podospora fimiseda]|uniref:Uncharacterized protein n=1 Tax=Podospora fimiseda TaxID=252190 RepID=A0AAN7GWW5_9PEZI|nr:hypothetical protein QBC38DRAFT_485959 [Podospora fimiseda]